MQSNNNPTINKINNLTHKGYLKTLPKEQRTLIARKGGLARTNRKRTAAIMNSMLNGNWSQKAINQHTKQLLLDKKSCYANIYRLIANLEARFDVLSEKNKLLLIKTTLQFIKQLHPPTHKREVTVEPSYKEYLIQEFRKLEQEQVNIG